MKPLLSAYEYWRKRWVGKDDHVRGHELKCPCNSCVFRSVLRAHGPRPKEAVPDYYKRYREVAIKIGRKPLVYATFKKWLCGEKL